MVRRTYLKISGGVGNQLFQYAFALFLQKATTEKVYLDGRGYIANPEHDGFLLPQLFLEHRDLPFVSRSKSLIDSIGWKDYEFVESKVISPFELIHFTTPFTFRPQRVTLKGHWQWYLFPFLAKQDLRSIDLPAVQMEKFQSKTFIHIRGGDYLNNPISSEFYDIIDKEYYNKSIAKVLEQRPNQEFILFTDDLEYARSRLGTHMARISVDQTQSSLEVLAKMRACSGAIMANSSFSWWGAFLQENKGIQIAPKKWNSKMEEESAFIYPPYVIRY